MGSHKSKMSGSDSDSTDSTASSGMDFVHVARDEDGQLVGDAHLVRARDAEHVLVPIPGAQHECGRGDASRALRLAGGDLSGAHTSNPAYFRRLSIPGAWARTGLRLRSVCWLAVGGALRAVPSGEFEAIVRVRITRAAPNFVGDWRVGVGASHVRDWPRGEVDSQVMAPKAPCCARVLRHYHGEGAGGELLARTSHALTALSFGTLRLPAPAPADGYTVKLSFGGGNPHWASDLEIDCFELRAVGLPWSVLRLVFLAFDGRRPAPAAIAARHVPLRALDLIVRMLHTPVALRSRTPARPG